MALKLHIPQNRISLRGHSQLAYLLKLHGAEHTFVALNVSTQPQWHVIKWTPYSISAFSVGNEVSLSG